MINQLILEYMCLEVVIFYANTQSIDVFIESFDDWWIIMDYSVVIKLDDVDRSRNRAVRTEMDADIPEISTILWCNNLPNQQETMVKAM